MSALKESVNDSKSRNDWDLSSFVVPVAVFVGVLGIILGVNTRALWVTAQKSDEHEKVILEAEYAKERVLLAQVNFKKQVQEWKNVLLRGSDEMLRVKYFGRFEAREADVLSCLEELHGLAVLGEDPLSRIDQLIEEMRTLGIAYRDALSVSDVTLEGSYRIIDQRVRGIDREPTREMDLLVEWISLHSAEMIAASAENIQKVKRAALIQSFGSALIGVILGLPENSVIPHQL